MKNILVLLLSTLAIFTFAQTGETFTIIKVNGEILNVTAGNQLTAGSVINASDQLEFSTDGAEAIAISSSRGKFVIKLPPTDLFGDSEALAYANTAASPVSMRAQYSVRSLDPRIDDLSTYLGKGTFYIIGDEVAMNFSESAYPLSTDQFFSVTYTIEGNEVSVDIFGEGQTVNFNRQTVFAPYTAKSKISAVNFYALDAKKGAINHLTTVNIEFVPESELTTELTTLTKVLEAQNMERKEIRSYLKQYFADVYGNTDPSSFAVFISKVME